MMNWRPDTCGCELLLDPESNNVSFVKACTVHAASSADSVRAENMLKNTSYGVVEALAFPDLSALPRPDIRISWTVDEKRVVHFQLTGKDAPRLRDPAASALTAQFGAMAVID